MNRIYTIGTSIHSNDDFCSLLLKYRINAIADVRSVPYSKHTPQFNKDILVHSLQRVSIRYLDFGAEFGARRTEQEAYTDNKVDFEKVVKLPVFLSGVERISTGINKGFNIALMCTEKNPLDCHRFSLLSNPLSKFLDIDIEHILFDGNIVTQQSLENELLHDLNLDNDLFISRDELLKSAYDILEKILDCDYIHQPNFTPDENILKKYKKKIIDWEMYTEQYIALLNSRTILSSIKEEEIINFVDQ